MKTLLSASAIVFGLGVPALAQPAPAPNGSAPPMKIDLTVKVGTETRVHQIVVSDDSCGSVHAKARDFEDEIRVCSNMKRDGLRLEASWKVRAKTAEYHVSWTAAVARGGTVETSSADGARFTLAVK
ncbi:MAG: hypothetical protein H0T42_20900 [Deltaproteobacteria bacterium]|nr:hypothetical protein [Deltaproteobacteria bacterium]